MSDRAVNYIIRKALPNDAEAMIAYMRVIADEPNNGVTYSSASEFIYTVDQERELIRAHASQINSRWVLAVAGGRIVGGCSCSGGKRGAVGTVGLGITVAREWRGKGIGKALMQDQITWARSNPAVHRLELEVFTNNPVAIALYDKLGFQREGIRREAFFKHGEYLDMLSMAMLF